MALQTREEHIRPRKRQLGKYLYCQVLLATIRQLYGVLFTARMV